MSTKNCLYALLITTALFYFMSRINNVCLLVINNLWQRCHELSQAKWYNLFPALRKLSKDGTEIVQDYDSCHMPGFCSSIVLSFFSGVKLFDYVLDGGNLWESGWGKSQMGDMASRWEGNQTLRTSCIFYHTVFNFYYKKQIWISRGLNWTHTEEL